MRLPYTLLNEALKSSNKLAQAARGVTVAQVARKTIQFGPAKDLAMICGRAGVAGAVVDGSMGAFHAARAFSSGRIDSTGVVKHIAAEAGCGFATSSAGTAGTLAAYMVTGTMGPAALVAGMGASMGTRWAYRKLVGETLADPATAVKNTQPVESEKDDEGMEEIGPES